MLHREERARARGARRIVVANHALVMVQAALRRARRRHAAERATCSTRAIICSMPPTAPSRCALSGGRRRNCAAGCSAPRRRGRRARGLQARHRRSDRDRRGRPPRRCRGAASRRARCPATAGTSASPRAPAAGVRGLSRRSSRQQVLARADTARDAGLRPRSRSAAARSRGWSTPRRDCAEAARPARRRADARSSRLLRKQLEDAENPPELDTAPAPRRGDPRHRAPRGDPARRWSALLREISPSRRPRSSNGWRSSASTGSETDIALNRNWVDPGHPFRRSRCAQPAHGIVVTSATLTDGERRPRDRLEPRRGASGSAPSAGEPARRAHRLALRLRRADAASSSSTTSRATISARSPAAFARADAGLGRRRARPLHRDQPAARRARAHRRRRSKTSGLLLLAQHVDAMSPATLVDIFRAEEDSCLLGTDAVRDGVDVPGRSLRLIVFDRVPWPRPDILHRAPQAGIRRRQLRRPHRAAPAAPGLWPADPPRRRPRRLRRARPAIAVAAAGGVSRRRAGRPRCRSTKRSRRPRVFSTSSYH